MKGGPQIHILEPRDTSRAAFQELSTRSVSLISQVTLDRVIDEPRALGIVPRFEIHVQVN